MVLEESVKQRVELVCLRLRQWFQEPQPSALHRRGERGQQIFSLLCQGEQHAAPIGSIEVAPHYIAMFEPFYNEAGRRAIEAQPLSDPDLVYAAAVLRQDFENAILGGGHSEGAAFLGKDRQSDLMCAAKFKPRPPIERIEWV